jgi:hypothetical protein
MTSEYMSHLSGHQFEVLVEKLIEKMGFIVEERKKTVDGGIDILAKSYEPILGGTYVIQCKRYTKKVGQPVLRDLYGVVHSKNANKGILITNSTFTKKAIEFARNKQLELIDGTKLRSLLFKYELVKPEEMTVVLPNYARFLRNNFVSALRKIQDEVEDIKNGRFYVEKTTYSVKRWGNICLTKTQRLENYATFVTNIINHWGSTFVEKEPDLQQIENDCGKIIDATKKLVDDYKSALGAIPPQNFSVVHEKLLDVYPPFFETIFRFADDTEKATTDPKPQIYQISVVFHGNEMQELAKALKDKVEQIKQSQRQKSWWL